MPKKYDRKRPPTIATGIDDEEELDAKATQKELEQHQSTKVTKLSYDEVDPKD